MNKVVVIPIYKSTPEWFEEKSLNQVVKVLFKHEFSIVTFEELDISYYTNLLKKNNINFGIRYFDKIFFESVVGYNQLMLSKQFYQAFINYEFMLIYQLDAYVFRDELDYWCEQNYDFIGAPLIEDKFGIGNKYFLNDFNGGFSLRKIKYCLDILSYKGPLIKPFKVYELTMKEYHDFFLKKILKTVLRSFGRQNNICYFKKGTFINEDLFFCLGLYVTWIDNHIKKNDAWVYPKLPVVEIAKKFSFERYPDELFKTNNNELPFGCHAWQQYEYESFWKKFLN